MAEAIGGMQLGLLLRNGDIRAPSQERTVGWAELREMARTAEAVGFHTLWAADHLIYRASKDIKLPAGESRGIWEAWTLLSALAVVTDRVTLGPFVACTSFRNPALLAKMADTLDEVSGGRLILGLGAGWHEPEYDAFGYPFDHRAGRFEEALGIIVPLLRAGHVDFSGRYYQARDCELRPRGPRPGGPPIWIGASGPRMMRQVARNADAYNTVWHSTPDKLVAPFAHLDEACREVGRHPATILRTAGCFVTLPGASGSPDALTGPPDEIARRLHAFADFGVRHMTVILDPWNAAGIEQFGRVIDALRKLEG